MTSRAPWIWAAILAALWVTFTLCAHWEPVIHDGWGGVYWYRTEHQHPGIGNVYDLLYGDWAAGNPRLGQTVTVLLYAPGPYHVLITPVCELALFTLMTAMVLGRWPSVRRADDALAFVTVTAIMLVCTPKIGPMLFYRPYFGNYLLGLLLGVAWCMPYRFQLASPRSWRMWWLPLYFVLGAAAGGCNEHTGPAFLAGGVAAIAVCVRRGERVRAWMIVGLVGLAAGYIALMIAPGQGVRYDGLAHQAGLLGRVVDRGLLENARVIGRLPLYLAWAIPWIVLAAFARRATRDRAALSTDTRLATLGFAAMGTLCTLALLGSPKIGSRLYVHSVGLVAIALTAWILPQLTSVRTRRTCAALSAGVLGYAVIRCLVAYGAAGPVGAARLAAVERAPPGATVVVPRFPVGASNWFLGDDFDSAVMRDTVATQRGLARIDLAPD